jgi:hypothetical protein
MFSVILSLVYHFARATSYTFFTAATPCILMFGVFLIIGACLMSRQPLEDDKRYDEEGKPTKTWYYALLGQKILLISLFMLVYVGLFWAFGVLFTP